MEIKFRGIDDQNRAVYKLENKPTIYVGSTEKLFSFDATKEQVNDYFKNNLHELEYFGKSFNCEPNGGSLEKYNLTIID